MENRKLPELCAFFPGQQMTKEAESRSDSEVGELKEPKLVQHFASRVKSRGEEKGVTSSIGMDESEMDLVNCQ